MAWAAVAVPVALKLTGLPDGTLAEAVTVLVPAVEPSVQLVRVATPDALVLMTAGLAGLIVPLPTVTVNVTAMPDLGLPWTSVTLTEGGALPALRGWAELTELEIQEQWRNRGLGTWLIQHAVAWMRLAGCDRIVFCVAPDDETRGAGRFYQRCGWEALVREQKAWGLMLTGTAATI